MLLLFLAYATGAAFLCAVFAIVAILAGAAILSAGAGRFDVGEAVDGEGKEEGAGGEKEESFHIFRFFTLKIYNMADSVNYLPDPIG